MALDKVTLTQFRNHADTRIEGARQFNLLVGENGAGKTNVISPRSTDKPAHAATSAISTM